MAMNDTVAISLELAAACVRARQAEEGCALRDRRIAELEAKVVELSTPVAHPEPLHAVPTPEEKEHA